VIDRELALLDTNVLVYATFKDDPFYSKAKELQVKVISGATRACLTPQILTEYYSAVTNPRRVTNPISPKEAREVIEAYLKAASIFKIYVKETTVKKMVELAEQHKVKGQDIFDVMLVATMLDNEIKRIYTANEEDFKKFEGIEVINPFK